MIRKEASLVDIATAIAQGDLSAVDYASELLRRIDADADLSAFITVSPDAVLIAAERADVMVRSAHRPLPPLLGVPIAVKDNIDTADLPTTGGTPALRDHKPIADAGIVSALKRAGAIVLGKTNLHELAYGITSENHAFGLVRNPHSRGRFAGGSSGGTAAAISAGLAPCGVGTDTGGSVRIPAALCGIAALRPTIGRYPTHGFMTLSTTRDTIGSLAPTVADVAVLDAAITNTAQPLPDPVDLRGVRFGLARAQFFAGSAPDVAATVDRHIAELERHGAQFVDVRLPSGTDEAILGAGFPIAFHETPLTLRAYLEATPSAPTLEEVVRQCGSPDVQQILTSMLGTGQTSITTYQEAVVVHRPRLARIFESAFEQHDLTAFLSPSTPLTAAPFGTGEVLLGEQSTPIFPAYTRTTGPFSGIGWPGLTLPAGRDAKNLPVGLAFDAPPGRDRTLLAVGRTCERIFAELPMPGDGGR